jgi:aspartate--ammonia ligase
MSEKKVKTTVEKDENLITPKGYSSSLNIRETEKSIKIIKDYFESNFLKALNLERISAPLFVSNKTGVNDYLNGTELPVSFNIKSIKNEKGEIVQSLAKWKRKALADYGFKRGEGLCTDMNAIRPDETLDSLHSLYVDQWDWERVMSEEDRNIDFLKSVVQKIYKVISKTEKMICKKYKKILKPFLPSDIYFVHSEELEEMYPDLTPRERENEICKEKGAVFVIGIGAKLKNGQPHDGRAADYDDWSTETVDNKYGLNGDILVWFPLLNRSFELSSMGIRVNKESLLRQLEIRNEKHKMKLEFHNKLLNGELPQTIGGGIGQSRLCMLFLRKAHVGEVQVSIWSDQMKEYCRKNNIHLL